MAETRHWKQTFGQGLNEKANSDMVVVLAFCEDISSRLGRKITDLEARIPCVALASLIDLVNTLVQLVTVVQAWLSGNCMETFRRDDANPYYSAAREQDVRESMVALKELRERQIEMDNRLAPVEQAYALLGAYGVVVARAESDRMDTLRFEWGKMMATSKEVQDHLIEIQAPFKSDLISKVSAFVLSTATFVSEYDTAGPNAPGVKPAAASERLGVFQARFDDVYKRYVTYSAGEELFGLPETQFTEIPRIKKVRHRLQQPLCMRSALMPHTQATHVGCIRLGAQSAPEAL